MLEYIKGPLEYKEEKARSKSKAEWRSDQGREPAPSEAGSPLTDLRTE